MDVVTTKSLVAKTDNTTKATIILKETREIAMQVVFHRGSNQTLNAVYLDKVMKTIESYLREVNRYSSDT